MSAATSGTGSGTRARTRRAILDAAIAALAADPSASLGQVADAADVGRTTLHRYFPDRAALVEALTHEALERIARASARARVDEGTAREALLRVCHEYLDLGDLLTLLFTEVVSLDGLTAAQDATLDPACVPQSLVALAERGHADGSVDPALPGSWVEGLVWSVLYLAWESLRSTGTPRHEVMRHVVRTVDKALR